MYRSLQTPLLIIILFFCSTLKAGLPWNERFFEQVSQDDPIRQIPHNDLYKDGATQLIDAARKGDWQAPVFKDEKSYSFLLYAASKEAISLYEFIDIQDYLHTLSDFVTLEDDGYQSLKIRTPALSITRYRASELNSAPEYDLIKNSKLMALQPTSLKPPSKELPEHWVTVVRFPHNLAKKFSILEGYSKCDTASEPSECPMSSMEQSLLVFMWMQLLHMGTPKIYFVSEFALVLGSIPYYLEELATINNRTVEFLPLYGSMDWSDLANHRSHDDNAASMFHPLSISNFHHPHGAYSGAGFCFRHDLIHHKLLSQLPSTHQGFYIWLHRTQQQIISALYDLYVENNYNFNDSWHQSTIKGLARTFIDNASKLHTSSLSFNPQVSPSQSYINDHMVGYFADMAFLYTPCSREFPNYCMARIIAEHLDEGLQRDKKHPDIMKLYVSLFFETLHGMNTEIHDRFNLNIDNVLDLVVDLQKPFTDQSEYTQKIVSDYNTCKEIIYTRQDGEDDEGEN